MNDRLKLAVAAALNNENTNYGQISLSSLSRKEEQIRNRFLDEYRAMKSDQSLPEVHLDFELDGLFETCILIQDKAHNALILTTEGFNPIRLVRELKQKRPDLHGLKIVGWLSYGWKIFETPSLFEDTGSIRTEDQES